MTNSMIRIHNAETGEIIDREITDEEIAQRDYLPPKLAKEYAEARKVLAAREVERQAILDRLGLTSDEAKLILG
jgi:hypothetical protein